MPSKMNKKIENQNFSEVFDKLEGKFKKYFDLRINLFKLDLSLRLADSLSIFLVVIIVMISVMAIIIFLGIAFSVYLGKLYGNPELGFLTVAGIYVVLIFVVTVFRKKLIQQPFSRLIYDQITNDDDDDEEGENNKDEEIYS